MNSIVIKTFGRALTPFILIYGIYVTVLGSKYGGGGFQGGVILASGIILILVTHGRGEVKRLAENISWFETFGAFVFLFIGLLGIVIGGSFLTNLMPGKIFMPLILQIVISLKVFAGLVALFIYFFGLGVRS